MRSCSGAALYEAIVGLALLIAEVQLSRTAGRAAESDARATRIPLVPAVVSGAGIGLLSGPTPRTRRRPKESSEAAGGPAARGPD